MIFTKWYEVSIGTSPHYFLNLLRRKSYDRSSHTGFDLSYATDRRIEGRFIEEVHTTTTYISPLGEEITNHLVTHKIIIFTFHHRTGANWFLRIDGNPRSIKSFSRTLSELLNFGYSISTIRTPILEVIRYLALNNFRIKQVSTLFASNLRVAKGGMGKLEVRAAASGDALAAFTTAFPQDEGAIERLTMLVEFESLDYNLTITKAAGIAFDDEISKPIVDIYMAYLGLDALAQTN